MRSVFSCFFHPNVGHFNICFRDLTWFDPNRIKRIPTSSLTFEHTWHFSLHCFALLHFGNACLCVTCLIWKSLAKKFAKTLFVPQQSLSTRPYRYQPNDNTCSSMTYLLILCKLKPFWQEQKRSVTQSYPSAHASAPSWSYYKSYVKHLFTPPSFTIYTYDTHTQLSHLQGGSK